MHELQTDAPLPTITKEFLAVCFCAEWCGTCREYRTKFQRVEQSFPSVDFFWIDIENNSTWAENFDPENFPTLLIQRHDWVLFYGTMLPHEEHLHRLLDMFIAQTPDQSAVYAHQDGRRHWQESFNFRSALLTQCK